MTAETSNLLKTALQLNNDGVSRLLEAKDAEAIACLKESLTIFQQILVKYNTTNQVNDLAYSCTVNNKTTGQMLTKETGASYEDYSAQLEEKSIAFGKTASLPNMEGDCCFIYDQVIKFDAMGILSSQKQTSQDIHMFIATVILNIALAYHRKVRGGDKQHMARAKKMYETVSKLLVGRKFDFRHQGLAFLLSLAATNNLSLIRYEEGDYHNSVGGFQFLAFLLSTHHNYNNFDLCGACYEEIVVGMSLNVVFGNTRPTLAGAA